MATAVRIQLAPEVAAVLPPSILSRVHDEREHTEIVCAICRGVIPPESVDLVNVLALRDRARPLVVVKYTHSDCSPSRIIDAPLRPPPPNTPVMWTPILRRHALPATLIWETSVSVRLFPDEEAVDPTAERLRRAGFRSATQRIDELVAPLAKNWSASIHDDTLIIRDPNGHRDELDYVRDAAPPRWIQAVRSTRRILVIYGSGFGQDRFSGARVDQVLQAGEGLCGLIPWRGD